MPAKQSTEIRIGKNPPRKELRAGRLAKPKRAVEERLVARATMQNAEAKEIGLAGNSMRIMMTSRKLSHFDRDQWNLAQKYIDQEQYLEAKEILDQILLHKRSEAKIYAHRAYVLYRLENYLAAISDFSTALEIHPLAKNTLFLRARCFEELGRFEEAIKDYDRTLSLAPDTADAYAQKGFCLEQLGQVDAARAAYQRALKLDPTEALALAGIGSLKNREN